MRKNLGVLVVVAMGFLPLNGAQAEAAVFCGATNSRPNTTVLALASENAAVWGIKEPPRPLPGPADGVVTGWRVPLGSAEGGLEQRLQVFRQIGPSTFLTLAESDPEVVSSQTRSFFKARIPIEKGDLFGLRGTLETYTCGWTVGVTSGLYAGATDVGSTYQFRPKADLGLPLLVAVEADADGDGYGDESQDRCPRVPTTQNDCPAVKLRIQEALVRAHSIRLRVTVATKAKVRVFAEVAHRQRLPGPEVESMTTEVIGGGEKTARPGKVASIGIKLPKALRHHLKERVRSLEADLTVIATNAAGRTAERELTVRLPGQRSS